MADPTPEKSKIKALEGLRGIMAWWVVIGHISLTLGWQLPLIDRNTLPVDVFILLSGFVIALLIDKKSEPYAPYLARRAFRIFPLYLAVLIVSTLLIGIQVSAWADIPFSTPTNQSRLELARLSDSALSTHFAIHAPLLQGVVPPKLLPGAPWTIVGQAWSLSLEWQFYIVAPLFVWALRTPRRMAVAVTVMLGASLLSRWFSPAFIGSYIWHFGIGICTYFFIANEATRKFTACAMTIFALLILAKQGPWQIIPLATWTTTVASVLNPMGKLKFLANALSSPAAVHQGERSYSIYFVHMIPLTLAAQALNHMDLGKTQYSIALFTIVVASTYVLSIFTYRWIEKPGIRQGAALVGWRPAAAGAN